jgi:hypothetical protein
MEGGKKPAEGGEEKKPQLWGEENSLVLESRVLLI